MGHRAAKGALDYEQRFELVGKLGEGGMGVVYKAFDKHRNCHVALKTMSRADPLSIYHLKTEFRALCDVSHPNLVDLYELFSTGSVWFFTMELVNGVTFIQHVRDPMTESLEATQTFDSDALPPTVHEISVRCPSPLIHGGELSVDLLRRALVGLSLGVQAIHDAGRLHRDLKPSNVLIDHQGQVKILDFGLVSAQFAGAGEGALRNRIVGTPAYMAPEQARGEACTPAADWYGVGVILYEALTGRLPYWGLAEDVVELKSSRPVERPSNFTGNVPQDLDDLCVRLLDLDPERRPSGSEILDLMSASTPEIAASLPGRASHPQQVRPEAFVGRRHELRRLHAAMRGAARGGRLVRLSGPSGIGKTALVRQFADEASLSGGATVLQATCYEHESLPFKGLDGIMDALMRHLRRLPEDELADSLPPDMRALARIFPVLAQSAEVALPPSAPPLSNPPLVQRRLAVSALGDLLSTLADSTPLVIIIDDFQWADRDTVKLLDELLGLPKTPAALYVLSHRSETQSASLDALDAFLDAAPIPIEELELTGLEMDETAELADSLLPGAAGDAAHLHRESGGSPLFVHELVRHVVDVPSAPLSTHSVSLDHALGRRISALPGAAREFLELLCVASRPMPVALIASIAHLPFEKCPRALCAERFAVTSEDGRTAEISHNRVRDAVLARLGEDRTRELHEALGLTLERCQAEPERLFDHFFAAGRRDKAFEYAQVVARNASEALAFDQAAHFYEVAIALADTESPAAHPVLYERLAAALGRAGRHEAARVALALCETLTHAG